jgi:hypothetical protein
MNNNKLNTPQERLKYFIEEVFKKQIIFAKKMDMRPSDLSKYIKVGGNVFTSADKHSKLSNLGLNINWYLHGQGDMINVKDPPSSVVKSQDLDCIREVELLRYKVESLESALAKSEMQKEILLEIINRNHISQDQKKLISDKKTNTDTNKNKKRSLGQLEI